MKKLSIGTTIEKAKIGSATPFIVLLTVTIKKTGEVIRLARNSEDVSINGLNYSAVPFEFDLKEEIGKITTLQVTIQDQTRAIQARMQAYDGAIGSEVKLHVVNMDRPEDPPEIEEIFLITTASSNNYVVTWSLGAENPLMLNFPRRPQSKDRCTWRYKSKECGYTGNNPSCDLTLQGPNGCAVHKNTPRFGAYPGIRKDGYGT